MVPETMKAAVLARQGEPLEIRTIPVPQPGPGELLVKLEACGVCHTDLHVRDGDECLADKDLPLILGHEGIGRVVATGPDTSSKHATGARVGLPWLYDTCLQCRECLTGFETFCTRQRARSFPMDGALAEYALVKEAFAVAVSEAVSAVEAAPLLCAGVTALGAINKAELAPGKVCAVFGCGGLGQYGVMLAKLYGATVVAVDRDEAKLGEAIKLGADHGVLADEHTGKRLRELGGADACINFAPSAAVWDAIVEGTNPRGWIISVAMVREKVPLSLIWLLDGGQRITGSSVGGRQELQDMMTLAAQHDLSIDTKIIRLEEADQALDQMKQGQITGRAVVDFSLA